MKIMVSMFVVLLFLTGVFGLATAQDILTLDDCVKKALQSNPLLEVENNNISEKAAALKKSKAETHPYIDATSNYQYVSSTSTVGASIDLSLDTAKLISKYGTSQEFLLQAAEEHKNFVQSTIVFNVKSYYFTLMKLRKEYEALRQAQNTLTHHRKITENFVNTGVKQVSALYRVDNQIAALQGEIIVKKAAMSEATDGLIRLMGIDDSSQYTIAEYGGKLSPLPSFSIVLQNAVNKSPELKGFALRELSLQESIKSAGTAYIPALAFGVGYNQDIAPLSPSKFDIHFSASVPLLDFGRNRYDRMQKTASVRKENAQRKVKEAEIRDVVHRLYKRSQLDKNLYSVYQQMYGTVQKTVKQIEIEYDAGIVSETDLLDVQKQAVDASVKMNGAYYDYLIVYSQIEYLQGVKK